MIIGLRYIARLAQYELVLWSGLIINYPQQQYDNKIFQKMLKQCHNRSIATKCKNNWRSKYNDFLNFINQVQFCVTWCIVICLLELVRKYENSGIITFKFSSIRVVYVSTVCIVCRLVNSDAISLCRNVFQFVRKNCCIWKMLPQ